MERKLLLLGLLRWHEMYGYQLNEFIDSHLGMSVHLTKPTAYRLLTQMNDEGWISFREEREGNRPPRRVYSITTEGETTFLDLLRESLTQYEPAEYRSNISMAFLDMLPAKEVIHLLQSRREAIEKLPQPAEAYDGHHGSLGLVVEHAARHLTTELEWLDEVIVRLESEAGSET